MLGLLLGKIAKREKGRKGIGTVMLPELSKHVKNNNFEHATDLQNRYQRYADQLQFNRDHLERARARYPHAFLPGALPFPIRQTGYTWHPRGEIELSQSVKA